MWNVASSLKIKSLTLLACCVFLISFVAHAQTEDNFPPLKAVTQIDTKVPFPNFKASSTPDPALEQTDSAIPQPIKNTGTQLDEYRIGAFDLLEISVFQVPEMGRVVRVNSQGMISLPLVGIVRAGGLTANELETVISVRLSQNLLQDPQVSVFIKEFISQRVTIEGYVIRTGIYPLTGKTTLLQVIAMSGGLDIVADSSNVKILRETAPGARQVFTYDLDAIRLGEKEDPIIRGNDTIVVDRSGAAYAVKRFTDTIRGFVGFGSIPLAR